ncbi:excinuclease ABC subunit UvrA [Chlamydiifrater phoenicopteri]|uniref:excinuclease ABC subunit UvrA n=1 Tax=Chlamydiifrater phoenicopteri TaxID=2681469 RepID=UPI001BD13A59|nr:excinuclease ABC subunit UvrA [Chlamydiifrater phoenicopteri]
MQQNHIVELINVRVRNLKNASAYFYFGEIVLLTGPSGSGKSSLAFDTIFASGHRQYASTFNLSEHFQLPQAPEADDIKGLTPTIAIHRHSIKSTNPYSTVGTTTKITEYLKTLFSLLGIIRDPNTKQPVVFGSKEKFLKNILALPENTKIQLRISLNPKNLSPETLTTLIQKGFSKILYDGQLMSLYDLQNSSKIKQLSHLNLVVDTISVKPSNASRIASSLFKAFDEGHGICFLAQPNHEEQKLSLTPNLPEELSFPLSPQDFSNKTEKGRCPKCLGLGSLVQLNPQTSINEELSISENACIPAGKYQTAYYQAVYDALAKNYNFSLKTPWKQLDKVAKKVFLHGDPNKYLEINLFGKKSYIRWKGVIPELAERFILSSSKQVKSKLSPYLTISKCPTCQGNGYHPWISNVTLGGKTFAETLSMPIASLSEHLKNLSMSPTEKIFSQEIIQNLENKISLMNRLGLGYLSCDRPMQSLSGGEARRTMLAKQISFGPVGIIYVLDEPSIGLHPLDTEKLSLCIQELKQKGNTIILVDHYDHSLSFADRIIDIGPKAGSFGGNILFNGTPEDFLKKSDSMTAKFLRKEAVIEIPKKRRTSSECLRIENISTNNLKNVTLNIPKGLFISITGVSGSGKSSLINDTLVPIMEACLNGYPLNSEHSKIKVYGKEIFSNVISINQKAPGKNKRSVPATYIGVFNLIRDLFAEQPLANQFGLTKSSFSFNTPDPEHLCSSCSGLGEIQISESCEEYAVPCSACKGKRFSPKVLSVSFRGKNIADILDMTALEAETFFQDYPTIHEKILSLTQIGLDHLQLGRPLSTLSEGECQRLKLAAELHSFKRMKKPTLYVLDEPTTGLHTQDIKDLLKILYAFTELGHTVVVVEHNAHVIKMSDLVIDLGPVGGPEGGYILHECTPEELIKTSSQTGRFLQPFLSSTNLLPLHHSSQRHSAPELPDIEIIQANKNNLKNIDVTIKRNAFNVISGPIASGKNSLAFGTIFSEGMLNYSDLLPSYLAPLLPKASHSEGGKVHNLSPVVALSSEDMKIFEKNAISSQNSPANKSLAKIVGIYDLLKLIFISVGVPTDPETQNPLKDVHEESLTEDLLAKANGNYVTIVAPFTSDNIKEEFQEKQRMGYVKFFGNKQIFDIDNFPLKDLQEAGAVINHLLIAEKNKSKISQAFSLAFDLSGDKCIFLISDKENTKSIQQARKGLQNHLGTTFPKISSETFSEENPLSSCKKCLGKGFLKTFDLSLHKDKLSQMSPKELFTYFFPQKTNLKEDEQAILNLGLSFTEKIKQFSSKEIERLLKGSESYPGIETLLSQKLRDNSEEEWFFLKHFLSKKLCTECSGTGLNSFSLSIKVEGSSLLDLMNNSFANLESFFDPTLYSPTLSSVLLPIKQKLTSILSSIKMLGLSHLSLIRSLDTLCTSELYFAYIVSKTSNFLSNIIYILESPASYLYPRELPKLVELFTRLKTLRNTIIATDRNNQLTVFADHNIHLGPLSGPEGGYLCPLSQSPTSATPSPLKPSKNTFQEWIITEEVTIGKKTETSYKAPLNTLACITGSANAEPSALLRDGFLKTGKNLLTLPSSKIKHLIFLDSHIDRSYTRSDVGTYLDLSPLLRKFFASLPKSIAHNLSPSSFSSNTKKGMCSSCFGTGKLHSQQTSLSQEEIRCPECHGFMLNPISLSVFYQEKHFGEILRLPAYVLSETFPFLKKLVAQIQIMKELQIDYLPLEKKLSSLSKGERYLIEIAKTLCKKNVAPSLYLLDKPSSQLDKKGIQALVKILKQLVNDGHSVLCADHSKEILQSASYVLELT